MVENNINQKKKKNRKIRWFLYAFIIFFIIPFYIMNELKEGEAYSKSLDIIKSNPEISTILGEPIKPSFFIKGTTGSDKEELIYSISGTKEQADVYVFAENKRGKIVLKKLIVEIENISRKIEIIPSSQQSK